MNTYTLTKEESDRFNILKIISIIFVVCIHSYAIVENFANGSKSMSVPEWLFFIEYLFSQVISRCAVPIFFLISSILLFKTQRDYKRTVKSKLKTLLIPYVIWNSFWIIVFILLQNMSFTARFFSGNSTPVLQKSFSQWLAMYGIGPDLPLPTNYPLWFVRDLMILTAIFPIIGKIADRLPKLFLIVIVTLLLVPIKFPMKQSLLWFCLGAVVVKENIHITILDNVSLWKFSVFYLLFTLITFLTKYSVIDVLFIFFGIFYWARVTKYIYNHKTLKTVFLKLSDKVFIIYVLHELTLSLLKTACMRLLPLEPAWLLIEYVFLPLLVIVGCVIVAIILKKFTPKLYFILTGAR